MSTRTAAIPGGTSGAAGSVARHIDTLGLMFILAAGLSTLVAAALLALGAGALTVGWLAPANDGAVFAARVTGTTFLVIAVVLLIWSALNAWMGQSVRRRRPWARTATLVLGVLNLFILPFGTALGIYTLWVLLNNETRRVFQPAGHP